MRQGHKMFLLRSTGLFFLFALLASFSAAEAQLPPLPITLFSSCEPAGGCSTCNNLLLAVNEMISDVNNFSSTSPLSYKLSSIDCKSLQNFQSACVTPCSSLSCCRGGCKNAVESLQNRLAPLVADYQNVVSMGVGGFTSADVAVANNNLPCFSQVGVQSLPPHSSLAPKPTKTN